MEGESKKRSEKGRREEKNISIRIEGRVWLIMVLVEERQDSWGSMTDRYFRKVYKMTKKEVMWQDGS